MSSLVKILQLASEILRKQDVCNEQTDGWSDGQPENIMPPATTYGGRRHN